MTVRLIQKTQDRVAYKTCTVYLVLTIRDKRTYISTKERVPVDRWNNATQKVSGRDKFATETNLLLSSMKSKVETLIIQNKLNAVATTKEAIEQLITVPDNVKNEAQSFWELWDNYIETQNNHKVISPDTYRQHKNSLKMFQDYDNLRKQRITLETITPHKVDNYIGYLREQGKKESTLGKEVKNLKTFLNHLANRGQFDSYLIKRIAKPKPHKQMPLVLEDSELMALEAVPLEGGLAKARDLFLLECYTALRFSDLVGMKPEQRTDTHLTGTIKKTREPFRNAITEDAKRILCKYQGKPLPVLSNPKINAYIKEVAQQAGLNRVVEVVDIRGQDRTATSHPIHELITSHTGRRTFVSRALRNGLSLPQVMQFTGHKNLKTLAAYVGTTESEIMEAASKINLNADPKPAT